MSTVLIVEDDPGILALLRVLLADEGYDIEEATDGLQGLLKLGTVTVDAVVLDVMMPDVDGIRVLDQLAEEHGTTPLPVLVITGSPQAARACAARLTPADVFLKPFEPSAVLDRLRVRLAQEATP